MPPEPVPPGPIAGEAGARPAGLAAPEGEPDDLKRIKGVGPKLEALLHSLGIYHFDQIAAWSPDEIAWVDSNLEGFSGRVTRDDWVGQARILAAGGETEHSQARRPRRGRLSARLGQGSRGACSRTRTGSSPTSTACSTAASPARGRAGSGTARPS